MKFLLQIRKIYVGKTQSSIKYASHVVDVMRQMRITGNWYFTWFSRSFSLFTKAFIVKTIGTIKIKIHWVLFKIYLFFLLNGNFYKQKSSSAMGLPLSPIVTSLLKTYVAINSSTLVWKCRLGILGMLEWGRFLNHLYSRNHYIKFTMEFENL